jgi:hypothetical protein
MPASPELDRDLRALFAQGPAAPLNDAAFGALALRVFATQYEALEAYRTYCQRRGALPQRLRHWSEIPAVPAQAFRDVRLWSDDDGAEPAAVFRTSGTTSQAENGARPGEHYMSAAGLALYDASLLPTFRAFVLPELTKLDQRSPLHPLVLGPPPAQAPHSSLWHMVDVAGRALFEALPRWFLPAGGLDVAGFEAVLGEGKAVCLIATDLALDGWLQSAEAREFRVKLPKGSRVLHTGGPKGRRRALTLDALYARIASTLGVPEAHCVGEYGMTELASQFYDDTLLASATSAALPRLKHGPPWVRALVVDVQTLDPVPPGTPGLLKFVDLANLGSVLAIQTEDRAIAATDEELGGPPPAGRPFRLLGRAQGSEPRGCSLDAEAVLA